MSYMNYAKMKETAKQNIESTLNLIIPGETYLYLAAINKSHFARCLGLITSDEDEFYWEEAWRRMGHKRKRKPGQAT